jgi:hypothetical protein
MAHSRLAPFLTNACSQVIRSITSSCRMMKGDRSMKWTSSGTVELIALIGFLLWALATTSPSPRNPVAQPAKSFLGELGKILFILATCVILRVFH